jgi:hypothetical protein
MVSFRSRGRTALHILFVASVTAHTSDELDMLQAIIDRDNRYF